MAASFFIAVAGALTVFRLAADGTIELDRFLEPCGLKQRYGITCPTCGMTTATLAFASGRVFHAFYIQPAAALAWSILTIAAFLAFTTAVFGVYFRLVGRFMRRIRVRWLMLALVIVVVAAWAVTFARALVYKASP